ncbi:MAG: Gmad2 immunoglobulin-like domain-containing protein [Patescibacteria group bacterium]
MTKKQSVLIFIILCLVLVVTAALYMRRYNLPFSKTTVVSGSENITLSYPKAGDTVSFPFTLEGTARVFENVVRIRLLDTSTKTVLFEDSAYADAPDAGQFGYYSKQIDYLLAKPTSDQVELQVFWSSPKDGSAIDPVIIPLTMSLSSFVEVAAYFTQTELNPASQCDSVIPSPRIMPDFIKEHDWLTAQKALEFLLHGPSLSEETRGLATQINPNVVIEDFELVGDTATVNFNKSLEQGVAGSCRVSAIRAQIEQTLKQFPYIKNVVIKVDGESNGVLQP